MDDINNNTLTTDNGLLQLKPETSRDEQLAFIDTLREIQGTQNQEIQNATHALGTDVTPRYGGLSGTNSYWLNQYQTPQTEARIASLRSAAQSSALQTALNNYLGRLQEQYNQAYRRAKKRSNNHTTTTPKTTEGDEVEFVSSGNLTSTEDAFAKRARQDQYYRLLPTIKSLREQIKSLWSEGASTTEATKNLLGDALTQYKIGG